MNVLKPHLQTTIWTLLGAGASQREIERVTGIDRKTIRGIPEALRCAGGKFPRGVHRPRQGKFLHPGHRLRCRRARPRRCRRASRIAASSRRNCGCGATPWPSTRTWSTSTASPPAYSSVNALRAQAAPPRARAIRSPGVPARRGDAGRLRRRRAHARAGNRPLSQAAAVRGDAALLPAQLPPCRVEVQPADVGPAARAGVAVLRWKLPLRRAGQPQGRRHQARPVRAAIEPGVRGHAGPLRRGRRPGPRA